MKVLVTGSTGFIGKSFCEIKSAYEVYKLPSTIRIGNESRNDLALIHELEGKNVVLHFAGLAHANYPEEDLDNINHLGTLELASAAAKAGVRRFIFLSSVNVHGLISSSDSVNESFRRMSSLSPSKVNAELGLLKLGKESGMEITIIRPVLVYGKGAPANMGMLIKIASILPFTPFGLINDKRSYISISNLCDFISLCVSHPKAANETFLITDDNDVSIKQLMDLAASGLGRKIFHIPIPVFVLKILGHVLGRSKQVEQLTGSLQIDISKAKNFLGWSPIETMEQAMSKLK